MSQFRVDGQVIVVTGASKGIGFAAAKALVARGANVALLARGQAGLDAALKQLDSDRAIGIATDACARPDVQRAFEQVVAKWGRLDGLVNNVGFQFARRIELMDEAEVRRLVDLNFLSVVFGCQCAIPIMRAAGGGRIVNISSASARHTDEFPHLSIYSSCKAAVDHFTDEMRHELKKDQIMMTVFSPGSTATGSIENFDPEAAAEALKVWQERSNYFDGAADAGVMGEAIAHCFEYPPGVAVEFMEVRPNIPTPKALETDW